ncbi:LuxR C-terminal-related transcriptional regulator [Kiritimatiellaeota bacterium B1221]|nr:LuxR C-terminal-related transcriptional regulator [Kiritimatiellaeota bacterium B1221]
MQLSSHQLTVYCRASEEFLKPDIGLGNYAERAFAFLEKIAPCEFVFFGTFKVGTDVLETRLSQMAPGFEQAMEAYSALMSKYPLYNWDHTVNGGKPFTRSDFFSRRQFHQMDIFAEVYKPLGIDDHCAIYVPGVEGEISFFGIERSRAADYTVEERNLLTLAQSLLGSARNLAKSRSRLADPLPDPASLCRGGLSIRESEVLALMTHGKTNEEIGMILNIQLNTVKEHVKRILAKTNSPNRLSASLWAMCRARKDQTRPLKRDLPYKQISMRGVLPQPEKV